MLRKIGRLRAGDRRRVGEPVKGSPLTLPLPCDMRGCEQQNLRVITKRKTPVGVSFFLEQHFCSSKVVDSKEQITVIFKGGLKSVQPLTK